MSFRLMWGRALETQFSRMVAFRRGSSSGSSMIVDGDGGSVKSKDGGGFEAEALMRLMQWKRQVERWRGL